MLRGSLLVLLVFGVGCSGTSANQRAALTGRDGSTLLVLPLNLATPMPSKLAPGAHLFWEELIGYLDDNARRHASIDPEIARQLWLESVAEARDAHGEDADFDDAAAILTAKLSRISDFGAVLAPSLVAREALLAGRNAHWDEVSRPIQFFARDRNSKLVARRTQIDGKAPASSVQIVILDAQGVRLHDALTGIDLLVRVRVTAQPSQSHAETIDYVGRTTPFENYDVLQESIRQALTPLREPDS